MTIPDRLSAALSAANAGYRIERELGTGGMATGAAVQTTVVHDWLAELRAKLAGKTAK